MPQPKKSSLGRKQAMKKLWDMWRTDSDTTVTTATKTEVSTVITSVTTTLSSATTTTVSVQDPIMSNGSRPLRKSDVALSPYSPSPSKRRSTNKETNDDSVSDSVQPSTPGSVTKQSVNKLNFPPSPRPFPSQRRAADQETHEETVSEIVQPSTPGSGTKRKIGGSSDKSVKRLHFSPSRPPTSQRRAAATETHEETERNIVQPSTSGTVQVLCFEELQKLEEDNLLFSVNDLEDDAMSADSDEENIELELDLSSDDEMSEDVTPTSRPPLSPSHRKPSTSTRTAYDSMIEELGDMTYELDEETEVLRSQVKKIKSMQSNGFNINHDIVSQENDGNLIIEPKQLNKLIQSALICPDCEGSNFEIRATKKNQKIDVFTPALYVYCFNCKKQIGAKCKSSSKTQILEPEHFPSKNTSTMALQFAIGAASTGIGYDAASKFLSHMNILSPSSAAYHGITNGISSLITHKMDHLKKCVAKVIIDHHIKNGKKFDDDGMLQISVSFDGIWLKRENSPLGVAFVVDIETGLIIDVLVSNEHCQLCKLNQSKKNPEDFLKWQTVHQNEGKCQTTFDPKTSTSMKTEAALKLFGRSETLCLRYTTIVSDKDSPAYKRLVDADPYKGIMIKTENCLSHITKKIHQKLNKVRTDGKVKITQEVQNCLASSYKQAINIYKKDYVSIRKYMTASFLHHTSSDKKPLHKLCNKKWCKYKEKIMQGETPDPKWHTDPKYRNYFLSEEAKPLVFQVLKEATSDKGLKLIRGRTQGMNDSIQSKLWAVLSKERFVGAKLIKLLVAQTFMNHNFSIVNSGIIYHNLIGLPLNQLLERSYEKQ